MAVDVSNLWKSCREAFGGKARIDFQILSRLVQSHRHPDPVEQKATAYIVTNPKQKHHAFYAALRGYGYAVKERFMRWEKSKPTHTDWDVGITIDALDKIDTYDTFCLASGDGDFSQLMRYLRTRGKTTMVLTFPHSGAKSLYKASTSVISLTEDVIYNQ